MPLSWFGTTPWDFTPHHADVVFPAICPRLIGPVEPVIFALILNRRPPFQCAASLIVGMA
ncbi:MAG: peptidase domain-containing ABC transporter, partial [Rhodobacter sp.]|nr:peptidase domain-containing ABC transporter [Rhodobacter sp.]